MPIFDIWKLASNIAGGASSVFSNMLNEKAQKELFNRAGAVSTLSDPLMKALTEGLVPGGDIRTTMQNVGLLDAAKNYSDARTGAASDAWRFGGAGAGRTGGLLRDAQRMYRQGAGRALTDANRAADMALGDLAMTEIDVAPVPKVASPLNMGQALSFGTGG